MAAQGGTPRVITICKTVLSGTTAQEIRDQTECLGPGVLRDLAVQLAEDPGLTVSVITYDDGTQDLEVLYTGPPHLTEHTIDHRRFIRDPATGQGWTLPVTEQSGLQDAVQLVHTTLLDAAASTPSRPSWGDYHVMWRSRPTGTARILGRA